MKFWCKVSYEAEFDVDDFIEEVMEDRNCTKEQAMERFAELTLDNTIGPIDGRADNEFYVPYTRVLEQEWRD